jgi:hypothetical protein
MDLRPGGNLEYYIFFNGKLYFSISFNLINTIYAPNLQILVCQFLNDRLHWPLQFGEKRATRVRHVDAIF